MNIFKKIKQLRYLSDDIKIANQEINDLENKIDKLSDILLNKETLYQEIKKDWIIEKSRDRIVQQEIDEINQKRMLNGINHLSSVYEQNKKNNQELIEDNQKLLKENQFLKQYKNSLTHALDTFDRDFPNTINFERLSLLINDITPDKDFSLTLQLIDNLSFEATQTYELKQLIEQTKIEVKQLLNNYRVNYIDSKYYAVYHLLILGIQDSFQFILESNRFKNLHETKTETENMLKQYFSIAVKGNESVLLPIFTPLLFKLEPLYLKLITLEFQFRNQTETNMEKNYRPTTMTETKKSNLIRKKKVVQPMNAYQQKTEDFPNDKLIKLRHP
ncbi:hypothetical protein [Vagococcus sp.]|uniref:hypothetical protein n=1 Tax=Vagococcus sp. TaxID=1933889 RepID=UPI003F95DB95